MTAASPYEVEVKRRFSDEEAARRFVDGLGVPMKSWVRQANHFFDTEDRRLESARYTLRMRVEGTATYLTAKGPSRTVGASSRSRLEAETTIESTLATALLAGTRDPLVELRSRVSDRTFDELWAGLDAVQAGARLRYFGYFENTRRTFPVVLPSGLHLEVLVDQSRFPGGRVDHEVEIEVPNDERVPEVESWLAETTQAVGVATTDASSKVARFFEALSTLPC